MKGGKAAKRWSKSEDLPLYYMLIAAFGTKSTGEIKVGHPCFSLYLILPNCCIIKIVF